MSATGRWVAIEHVPFEGPGSIATEAALRGTPLRVVRPYRGEPLPSVDELRGLVVMGGPMGVSDTAAHPYLVGELALLARAVAAGRAVLGVCLGAQLLAAALGAEVSRGEHLEIGPGAVALSEAGRADPVLGAAGRGELPVVHWHQDTFALPRGAVCLASSALYPNQAFRAGTCAYGLQFHVEVDGALAAGWREHLPAGVEIEESRRVEIEAVGRITLAAFFDWAERASAGR
ncbi:MAG TPA: type 1 glutamine amidotransferase [Solirubrobacteraceae bacterium]|nr:type 1 glutamine amidotransferase [Solirubrobacteraceae bacterium]